MDRDAPEDRGYRERSSTLMLGQVKRLCHRFKDQLKLIRFDDLVMYGSRLFHERHRIKGQKVLIMVCTASTGGRGHTLPTYRAVTETETAYPTCPRIHGVSCTQHGLCTGFIEVGEEPPFKIEKQQKKLVKGVVQATGRGYLSRPPTARGEVYFLMVIKPYFDV